MECNGDTNGGVVRFGGDREKLSKVLWVRSKVQRAKREKLRIANADCEFDKGRAKNKGKDQTPHHVNCVNPVDLLRLCGEI